MDKWLTRVGNARRNTTNCAVVFHDIRCAGCEGRCGVAVGGRELPVDVDLPDGATVEVVTSVGNLVWHALGVFGWPLGVFAAAAVVAEATANDVPVLAALPVAALGALGLRALFADPVKAPRTCPTSDRLRVVLE